VVFRLGLHGLSLGIAASPALWFFSAAVGLLIGGVLWRLADPVTTELQWTGLAWALQGQPLRTVQIRLDIGCWMLLECQGVRGAKRWQSASKADNRPQWAVWRAAVYCAGLGLHPELES
jgi:hypothetical protein